MINLNLKPSEKELKQFVLVQMIFCLGLAAWFYYGFRNQNAAIMVLSVSVLLFLVGRRQPKFIQGLFVFLVLVTYPIGWIISHALLFLIFYLVITPIGLVMKLVGYDPLHRKLNPDAESYWIKRQENKTIESYFKQY